MAVRSGCQPGCGGGGGTDGSCEEILTGCVGPALRPPLVYDPDTQTIGVCLSSNADSTLYLDGSGCLADLAGGGPGPVPPRRTIASLPAQFFGARSCASLDFPYGSPIGAEWAITQGIEWIDNSSLSTADGVAVWVPLTTGLDQWTTNHATGNPNVLASGEVIGSFVDAGNPYEPISQDGPAPAAEKPTGRDANWWGFNAATWTAEATSTVLERIAGRAVVCLVANTAMDVPANIRAVGAAQATEWVMIRVRVGDIAEVPQITAAGITAAVHIGSDTTITPATVTASGATWVTILHTQTDARITSFVAAGLNVVVDTDSTHTETTRALGLGARGVTCGSPVYARGALGTAAALAYRTGSSSWDSKRMHIGVLTRRTAIRSPVWISHGYTSDDIPGRVSEAEYQWNGTTPMVLVSTLLGELNPIPTPTDYTIRWNMYIRTRPGTRFAKTGIFFGFSSDKDITVPATGGVPGKNGYAAFMRPIDGSVVIGIITDGGYTELAEVPGSTPALNTTLPAQLVVTPTTITFSRGTDTVTVNDSTYRGAYVFEQKEEDVGSQFAVATDDWVQT